MTARHFAGPVLVSGAYITELSAFILILGFLPVSPSQQGWLFAVYSIALCAALPVAGLVANQVGAARVFRVGALVFAIASIQMTLVSDYISLMLSRGVQGIGAGLFSPMIPILLSQQKDDGARSLATWGGIGSLFSAAAPIVVIAIISVASWSIAWLLVPSLVFMGLALGTQSVLRSNDPIEAPCIDRRVVVILALILLNFGINTLFLFSLPNATSDVAVSGVVMTTVWIVSAAVSFGIAGQLALHNYGIFIAFGTLSNCAAILALTVGIPFVGAIFAGFGIAFTNTPTTFALLELVSRKQRSMASALDIISARIGGSIFVLVFGNTFT